MEIRVSKHINAPANLTFDVFSDIESIQDRIKGITLVEILSDVKHGVGTRWRETRVMFGQEATEEMEISKFAESQSYEVVASSRGMDYHTIYSFSEKDGGTQVEMIFSGKPLTLSAKLMAPIGALFNGAARKALENDMDNLKVVCEQKVSGQ